MNDTIDTLKIKVEGEGQSAVKTLDELITTLERIKGTTSSRSIGTLTSKLESLKSSINDIKTKNLSKLNAIFSTLSNANKINISPRLPERIGKLGEAVDTLDGIDFSKLNEMASGLSALSRVGHVNLPRVNGRSNGDDSEAVGFDSDGSVTLSSREVVSNDDIARVTKFSDKMRDAYHRYQDFKLSLQENNKPAQLFDKIGGALKPITSRLKAVGSAIKETFGTSILGRFASKIKETFSSLGRIAVYRIMRSLIKQVTEGFKTGIDDMYQYSKTFNGNFAQSMDTAASALLSFKNSIGAVVAPIINLLVPWLDKVVDKLIEINNTAAMVIAGLTGKSTYSKAVRVTTEYAEAANQASENTGKVTEKVEELKRSLAGLDEITIIGQNLSPVSVAMGGNDAVSNGLDYGSMFVEAPVDMAKVNEIKEKFETILEIAKWIALTIAAWKLAKFISSIAEALTGIGLLKLQMLGITMMIVGFGIEFAGAFDIGRNGLNLKNALMTALGAALGVAGSLLVFGTGPVGWTVGLTVALTVAVVGYIAGQFAAGADLYKMTEEYQQLIQISEDAKKQADIAREAFNNLEQARDKCSQVFNQGIMASALVDEIFDLAENTLLSNSQLTELQTKIQVLNGLGLDGLQLEFDQSTGSILQIKQNAEGAIEKIQVTRLEVKGLTDDLVRQMQIVALTDLITEAYKSWYTAASQQNKIQEEVAASQKVVKEASADYVKELTNAASSPFGIIFHIQKIGKLQERLETANEAYNKAKTAQEENTKALENSRKTIETSITDLSKLKSGVEDVSDVFEHLGLNIPTGFSKGIEKGTKDVSKAETNMIKSFKEKIMSELDMHSPSKITEDYGRNVDIGFGKGISGNQNIVIVALDNMLNQMLSRMEAFTNRWRSAINEMFDDMAYTWRSADFRSDGSYSYNRLSMRSIQRFAQGGFPEDGLFYANHNELVGQFSNGKTAVANNEQIVEGIAGGVAAANEQQNTLLREQNRLLRMLLEKDSTIDVSTIARAFNRKNQRDGKVTVPVAL